MNIINKLNSFLNEAATSELEQANKLLIKRGFEFKSAGPDERRHIDKNEFYKQRIYHHKNYNRVLFTVTSDPQGNITHWTDFVAGPVSEGGHHYNEVTYDLVSPFKGLKEHLNKYYG